MSAFVLWKCAFKLKGRNVKKNILQNVKCLLFLLLFFFNNYDVDMIFLENDFKTIIFEQKKLEEFVNSAGRNNFIQT